MRVLLKAVEEDQTIGGLEVPDTGDKKESRKGEVVALGTGIDKEGNKREFMVEKGQKVLYRKFSGEDVELEGEEYVIIDEKDIVAILE
jgi:chaperonin GroES